MIYIPILAIIFWALMFLVGWGWFKWDPAHLHLETGDV